MSDSSVLTFSENTEFSYPNPQELEDWIFKVLELEKCDLGHVNIIFCDDDFLFELNKSYLKHDDYTDIITFQYNEDPIDGELYISLDRIRENAQEFSVSFQHELHRVIIHGILHLIGYDDKSDEEKILIRSKENYYLKSYPTVE